MGQAQGRSRIGRLSIFVFLFLCSTYVGGSLLYQAGPLPIFRKYESTEAVVVRTYAEKHEVSTPDLGEVTGWCPRIAYKYVINGQEFVSNRYRPKMECQAKGAAESLLANYPVGSRIQVWYSKSDPQYAVIEKSIQLKVFFFYGGITLLWLLGNFFAFKQFIAPNKALQPTPKSGAAEL